MTLPANAQVVASPAVWMETAALEQLARVAGYDRCVRAVGMPDLHPGTGIPVGAVCAFDGVVRPMLVGSDAGCGVRVCVAEPKHRGDALLRRVESQSTREMVSTEHAGEALMAVAREGARGLARIEHLDEAARELAAEEPEEDDGAIDEAWIAELGDQGFGAQLGTIGAGNHFLEISRVDRIEDKAAAKAMGLDRDALVVVAHSGSRALGAAIARKWAREIEDGGPALQGDRIETYMRDLRFACRYARANRFLLTYRMLTAIGAVRPGKQRRLVDLTHNDVRLERIDGRELFVHRKGVAPAALGAPTVVLGTRGTHTWILRGSGDASTLASVAHGAGRRMARSEALAKMRARHKRAELVRTPLGGHVLCDDTELLFEEHPEAYKDIEPVVDALVHGGLATRIVGLAPVVTIKR